MRNTAGEWSGLGAGTAGGGNIPWPAGHRFSLVDFLIDRISCCPWTVTAGVVEPHCMAPAPTRRPLYTAEERRRRDATGWTLVQGILAPIQFAVFLVSLVLVMNYLASGEGYAVATASIVAKTMVLYTIMITGSIWEKKVFDRYLFAPAFYYEDVVSILVLTLHTAYLISLILNYGTDHQRMLLALAAYATYAVNATQFLLKFRDARLEAPGSGAGKEK